MFPPREPRPEHGQAAACGAGGGSRRAAARRLRRAGRERPLQRQGAVHPEVRLLPHADAGRHAGARPAPTWTPRSAPRSRTGFTPRDRRGHRPQADPPPAPQQRDAGRARHGPGREGRGRLRRLRGRPHGRGPGRAGAGGPGRGHDRRADLHRGRAAPAATSSRKAGATGNIGPSLDELASSPDIKGKPRGVRRASRSWTPTSVVVQGFSAGVMPRFEGKLTDKQVEALVQYLLGN